MATSSPDVRSAVPPGSVRPAKSFGIELGAALTDRSYIYRDAYRASASLTQAERCAYGLHGGPQRGSRVGTLAAAWAAPDVGAGRHWGGLARQSIGARSEAGTHGAPRVRVARRPKGDIGIPALPARTSEALHRRCSFNDLTALHLQQRNAIFRCRAQTADIDMHCLVVNGRTFVAARSRRSDVR